MKARGFARWMLACALLGACTRSSSHEEDEAGAAAPVTVKTVAVRRGTIDDVLVVTGETLALSTVRLSSPIAGRVTWLEAQPGDSIGKGSVVARVMSAENEAAVHGLELLGRSDPSAAELAELRKRVGARDVPVASPIAGRVSARLHSPGEQVAAGDVLIEAFDPRTLAVVAEVPLTSAARVTPGLAAEVSGPDFSARGKVDVVVPAATGTALTVPVRITLAEQPGSGVLHEPVRARIWLEKDRSTLLLPRAALVSSGAGRKGTVVVAAGGHARLREIEIGLRSDTDVEVISGLTVDEMVVVEGGYGIADGAAIGVHESPTEHPGGEPE